jgi:hypothetical protein
MGRVGVGYARRLLAVPMFWRPRQDLNLRTRFRKPVLYPLSYGGKSMERTRLTARSGHEAA